MNGIAAAAAASIIQINIDEVCKKVIKIHKHFIDEYLTIISFDISLRANNKHELYMRPSRMVKTSFALIF